MNTFQRIIKYAALALAFSIIVSILSLLFGFISSISEIFESSVSTDISTKISTDYTGSQINSLEIDLKEVSLYIIKGNSFNVKTNTDKITSEVINEKLKIKDKSSKYSKNKIVELTIPENVILNEIDIEVGLGKNNIELLNANNIKLELGAGKMTINNINAYTNFEVDGGSGEINIMNANVAISNPEQLYLTAKYVTKGNAIQVLQHVFNSSEEDTVVFGGGYNDIEMFGHAYFSYAMQWADSEVRRSAKHIAENVNTILEDIIRM